MAPLAGDRGQGVPGRVEVVTWQEPKLPDDEILYIEYLIIKSWAELARKYDCNESSVRKRVRRYEASLEE